MAVVTLDVVKALLDNQADAYKATFNILIQDVKDELKSVRNELNDLKSSLQFTQCKFEKKIDAIDKKVSMHSNNLNDVNSYMDSTEGRLEWRHYWEAWTDISPSPCSSTEKH